MLSNPTRLLTATPIVNKCTLQATLARISSAALVHRKGSGAPLVSARYWRIAVTKARVLEWVLRRSCFSVNSAKQRSTRFSQDAPVGVKWR